MGQDVRHQDQFAMFCYRKYVRNIVCCLKCNVIAFDIDKAGKGYWRRLSFAALLERSCGVVLFLCVCVYCEMSSWMAKEDNVIKNK